MKRTKLLALFAFILSTAAANNCVPLTFTTLSHAVSRPITYEVWQEKFNGPPGLQAALDAWKESIPDVSLTLIWTCFEDVPYCADRPLKRDAFYLWMGVLPEKFQDSNDDGSNCHCALVKFFSNGVAITHTLEGEDNYFIEVLTYKQFVARTYFVYEVDSDK